MQVVYEAVLELIVLVAAHVWVVKRLRVVREAFLSVGFVCLRKHDHDCWVLVLLPYHAPDVRPAVRLRPLCRDELQHALGFCGGENDWRGIYVVEVSLWHLQLDSVRLIRVDVRVPIAGGVFLGVASRVLVGLVGPVGQGLCLCLYAVSQALEVGNLKVIPPVLQICVSQSAMSLHHMSRSSIPASTT